MRASGTVSMAVLATLAGLALAGCGSQADKADSARSDAEHKSAREMYEDAQKTFKPKAGQYEQSMEVVSIEVPGMPSEQLDRMRLALSRKGVKFCLTPEQVDKGFEDMFKNVNKDGECQYSQFDVTEGSLRAHMTCKAALAPGQKERGQMDITMTGALTENSSDVVAVMDITGGPAPMEKLKITNRLKSQRIGDCKPA